MNNKEISLTQRKKESQCIFLAQANVREREVVGRERERKRERERWWVGREKEKERERTRTRKLYFTRIVV